MRLRLQKGIASGAIGESAVWDVVTVEDDDPRSEDASIGSLHCDHRGWFFAGPTGALREGADYPLPAPPCVLGRVARHSTQFALPSWRTPSAGACEHSCR
jgi:hypothetical protein